MVICLLNTEQFNMLAVTFAREVVTQVLTQIPTLCKRSVCMHRCTRQVLSLKQEALQQKSKTFLTAQCLKITQNIAFEFFNFGIFHQFLTD